MRFSSRHAPLSMSTALAVLAGSSAAGAATAPPALELPHQDVIAGPFTVTAGAGGAWFHGTEILDDQAYDLTAVPEGHVGLRVSFRGLDLSRLELRFFPDVEDVEDWSTNRWSGGVQLGVCTTDRPPPHRLGEAMGPHIDNSAGLIVYVNPTPNQGGDAWWAPRPPGRTWSPDDPRGSGYDIRPGHGGVANVGLKTYYVYPDAPPTHPREGGIVFPGEYDDYVSTFWYPKESRRPHTDWVTGEPPDPQETHACNTFDVVIDYRPLRVRDRASHGRYRLEWWVRRRRSAAELEGGRDGWIPDATDAGGGWVRASDPTTTFGGRHADGTLTRRDEPGFDLEFTYPYIAAFGWWREDQPEQTISVDSIVVEYAAHAH